MLIILIFKRKKFEKKPPFRAVVAALCRFRFGGREKSPHDAGGLNEILFREQGYARINARAA